MRSTGYGTCLIAFSMATSISFASDKAINQDWDINTEFVYMRLKGGNDKKLVKNSKNTVAEGLDYKKHGYYSVSKLYDQAHYEPGGRLGLSYRPNTKSTFEAGFMYLAPWNPEKKLHQKGTLYFPFKYPGYALDYTNATDVGLHLHSQFYTLDVNYWRNSATRYKDFIVISGIIGIRYFHYQEKFRMSFQKPNLWFNPKSHYKTSTQNDTIGPQAGFEFQMNPYDKFSFDISAVAGIGFNRAENHVSLKDNNDQKVLRNYSRQGFQSSIFLDTETKISYQVTPVWNLNLGYQLFYGSGLALAPEQVSSKTGEKSKPFHHTGDIMIYGGMLGFDFTF